MKKIVLIVILATLISCKNDNRVYNIDQEMGTSSEKKADGKKFIWTETNVSIYKDCKLENLLEDPNISKIAKQLYKNSYKLKNEEPIELLEQLYNPDKNQRQFYFKAITNSYKISDGSYSEALGLAGKEFIESKTKQFASNFDDDECFSKKDLETWADIVMLEFKITEENSSSKKTIENYNESLIKNCKSCTEKQKLVIEHFTIYLIEKEKQYFKK